MVKIQRSPVPPASLSMEAKKACGSYCREDVVIQLREDSCDKCYLCELKNLSDPEVEHLRSHDNRRRKELVFDWNNLFYACRHCNLVKTADKYYDKILDCCAMDPESVLEHVYMDGHVEIHSKSDDEKARMTADLIQNCFELKNSGIRVAACQYRVHELAESMGVFYKVLNKYKENPEVQRYRRSLHGMLNRSSKFAAFKRTYIKKHIRDYPELAELVLEE